MNKKVFIVAGGTGGHLFPALALVQSSKLIDFIFLVDERTEKFLKNKKYKYYVIPASKIQKNIILMLFNSLKIINGFLRSIFLILIKKPDLVVGFGGYTSIPCLVAAKLLGKKILIHEQNSVMGKTNRILSKISNKVAITYQKTIHANSKSIYSGIPIRIKSKYSKKNSIKKKIFVIGGSQGAKVFSIIIPKILNNLDSSLLKKISIVQQAKKEDHNRLKAYYKKLKINYKLKDFFEDSLSEIRNSDIVISRGGSSSLAEIEYFNKFSIIIPLPSSADNHQYYNAIEFKKKNDCIILNEKEINYIELKKIIIKKLNSLKPKKSRSTTKKIKLSLIINDMLN